MTIATQTTPVPDERDAAPEDKRKVRTLVRDGDDLREFEFLEDGADFVGVALDGDIGQLVCETIEPGSTVVIFDPAGLGDDGASSPFAAEPPAHRMAVGLSGLVMMYTSHSRHPVLAVNGGEVLLFVVSAPETIEAFLRKRYADRTPRLTPPPTDPRERWVLSLTSRGELLRTKVGLGVRPGTPQA